jgi:hypothetical protein
VSGASCRARTEPRPGNHVPAAPRAGPQPRPRAKRGPQPPFSSVFSRRQPLTRGALRLRDLRTLDANVRRPTGQRPPERRQGPRPHAQAAANWEGAREKGHRRKRRQAGRSNFENVPGPAAAPQQPQSRGSQARCGPRAYPSLVKRRLRRRNLLSPRKLVSCGSGSRNGPRPGAGGQRWPSAPLVSGRGSRNRRRAVAVAAWLAGRGWGPARGATPARLPGHGSASATQKASDHHYDPWNYSSWRRPSSYTGLVKIPFPRQLRRFNAETFPSTEIITRYSRQKVRLKKSYRANDPLGRRPRQAASARSPEEPRFT